MTDNKTLSSIGEIRLTEKIMALLPGKSATIVVPPGDDSAAVRITDDGQDVLLTSDPVISGIHFDPKTEPGLIGRKAAGRVISDIAAMGGAPAWLLLNIAAPEHTDPSVITGIVKSAQALAAEFEASVVGGDVAKAPVLSVNAFCAGLVPSGKSVTRAGASAGDLVFVTGTIGGSRDGRHLSFQPRVREGIWLRRNSFPSAMIDITDGLATDLRHIMSASRAGAELMQSGLPLSDNIRDLPEEHAVNRALTEGEDFELLFTVHPSLSDQLQREWKKVFKTRLSLIGHMNSSKGILSYIDKHGDSGIISSKGFDHFA